jgi:hypothetical protein
MFLCSVYTKPNFFIVYFIETFFSHTVEPHFN